MSNIVPVIVGSPPGGSTPPTQVLTASDVILAAGINAALIVITGATTGSITVTIDDPNSQSPAFATAFNADVPLTVASVVKKVFLLTNLGRFKDVATGNINITTSGTPAGSNIEVYAVG
jgi:hypothetical protein